MTDALPQSRSRRRRRDRRRLRALAIVLVAAGVMLASASSGSALGGTSSSTISVPASPAASYSGSAGGDGWDVSVTATRVFSIFHHLTTTTVACHVQADASTCAGYPKTVTDGGGNSFGASGHSGTYIDPNTGRLWFYATRNDSSAGVLCIDTLTAAANPFCGYTPLAPVAEATPGFGVSNQFLVGTRLFAFNYVGGSAVAGAMNKVLCFDISTQAACPAQPYSAGLGSGTITAGSFPTPAVALIGTRLIVPITVSGVDQLACFNTTTLAPCVGVFPVTVSFPYVGFYGAPYPRLTAAGTLNGFCLPTGTDPCYLMNGTASTTPAGMSSVITATLNWNGPAVVRGTRVLLASGFSGEVLCYDYATGATCPSFPKFMTGAFLLYTVNPDPYRPDCLWINADGGPAQIQNFDVYTGEVCGLGPVRIDTSGVVPVGECAATSYVSLHVDQPLPSAYSGGSVSIVTASNVPYPGTTALPIDASGNVDLTGLDLLSAGPPQFLVTLPGATGQAVSVTLTWNVADASLCTPNPPVDVPEAPASWLLGLGAAVVLGGGVAVQRARAADV